MSDAKAKLEVLRKGCCHPQVWDKDLARRKGQGMARPFEEIMILKVEHSRLACEEKQRELVFHLNSLAGVAMLQAQLLITEEAVYRRRDRVVDVDRGVILESAFPSPSPPPSLSLRAAHPAAELSAADYLRRAMRAFCSAYSCLERNRQTCPLLGLVRLSGSPEAVFRVTRPAEGGQLAEADRNLINTELRADHLCLNWSCRLPRAGEGGSGASEEEVNIPVLYLPSAGAPLLRVGASADGESVGSPALSSCPSSLQAESVFSLCGHRAPVSARMAFGAGRRLQKLRVRSRASALIADMRSRMVSSGGTAQEAVLLFPSETSLSAATGVADAFTRVALFDLALPCVSALCAAERPYAGAGNVSDPVPPSNGLGPGPDQCNPFPLDLHLPLSTQSMQDFPLTIRARSWRLDVLSVHGWCLHIKIQAARPCCERGEGESAGEGNGGLDGDDRGSVVTGQWRRTATLLTPQARPSPSPSAAAGPRIPHTMTISLCMEVEVFEAAFDVDLFQVKISILPHHHYPNPAHCTQSVSLYYNPLFPP